MDFDNEILFEIPHDIPDFNSRLENFPPTLQHYTSQIADFPLDTAGLGEEDERLTRLEYDFSQFANETNARLLKIESGVESILKCLTFAVNKDQPVMFNTEALLPVCADSVQGMLLPATPLSLTVVPSMTLSEHVELWYTKRPYPDFTISFLDPDGNPFSLTQGWLVGVRAISGHGSYVDQFLYGPTLQFTVVDGKATVSGIKFSAVTSRNGGFFELEISVINPVNSGIAPVRSQRLRILSERLKNESKAASIFDLTPEDSLMRVPGIGKKYRARFSELGIKTVRDLATVSSELLPSLHEVLQTERGALNEEKLERIMGEAKHIVQRVDARLRHETDQSIVRPTKRAKC